MSDHEKKIRLHKVLAATGVASRRQIERWIKEGLVQIDGVTVATGARWQEGTQITLRGQPLPVPVKEYKTRALIYHKPAGSICTRVDRQQRPTVFQQLPHISEGRWIGVGRLDINSSGLMLFTNNGELAKQLMHPSSRIQRVYLVRVRGKPTHDILTNLREGVLLEDGMARLSEVSLIENSEESDNPLRTGSNRYIQVKLWRGRKREVRRLLESQGLQVSRLLRISYGPIHLPKDMKPGNSRQCCEAQIKALQNCCRSPLI